ncbi:MAG: Holliday junction resolvase RuvX [Acidobacteria bacterium]|nr:Holliday junction resolvase RuvX [Acidobacteriota bacterium]
MQKDHLAQARGALPGRVLAIDLGARRIGLAISDPMRWTAQGLPTLVRRNARYDLDYIQSLVRQYDVALVLLGNPLNMDGSEGGQSARAREFAERLRQSLKIEVRLWDERLTTVEARLLLQESGMKRQRKGRQVDRLAAAILLQDFLETQRTCRPSSPEPSGVTSGEKESI